MRQRRTILMGILNVTPDSFSDGGHFLRAERALERGCEMAAQGADIIDVGGESTRPYSRPVSLDEELERTIGVVAGLAGRLPEGKLVSIDTTKAEVARRAVQAGASVINDVSALRADPDMARVAAETGARVVLMHMKGTPADMQVAPTYDDIVAEVFSFLEERIDWATGAGIERGRLIIDPGVGFGKRLEDNLALIANLSRFKALGCPVLVGPSRKAFLGSVCGIEDPLERDSATAACVALSVAAGADAVRVHEVALSAQAALLAEAVGLKPR